jgi:lipopolysaccharide assembly outer membrane protein LptD (OstA)
MHRHAPPFKLTALLCVLLCATHTVWAQEGIKADGHALQLRTSPQLPNETTKADEQSPLFLRADEVSGVLDDVVTAQGHAELRKRGLSVKADVLSYQSVSDLAEAKGNVRPLIAWRKQGAAARLRA